MPIIPLSMFSSLESPDQLGLSLDRTDECLQAKVFKTRYRVERVVWVGLHVSKLDFDIVGRFLELRSIERLSGAVHLWDVWLCGLT